MLTSAEQRKQREKRTVAVRSKDDLPPAAPRAQIIYISEDNKPAYSDGTNWRWFSNDAVVS